MPKPRHIKKCCHNFFQHPNQMTGFVQDGERRACDTCGRIFIHSCDEAEGCWWTATNKWRKKIPAFVSQAIDARADSQRVERRQRAAESEA